MEHVPDDGADWTDIDRLMKRVIKMWFVFGMAVGMALGASIVIAIVMMGRA